MNVRCIEIELVKELQQTLERAKMSSISKRTKTFLWHEQESQKVIYY